MGDLLIARLPHHRQRDNLWRLTDKRNLTPHCGKATAEINRLGLASVEMQITTGCGRYI
jgi:hypothetical protein